jgi:hypothetical protein
VPDPTDVATLLAFASLVVIPLAQVPLVAYLSRYVELDPDESLPQPDQGYVTYGTTSAEPASGPLAAACPECGAAVEAEYDYCGSCAAELPPAWARR